MNQGPPDPRAPESQPTRQGRRFIQMLFRSGVDDPRARKIPVGAALERDSRAEDTVSCTTTQQEPVDNQPPLPIRTSKFSALKRKLFPSQNRRHPRRVPPLFISPLNAPTELSLVSAEEKSSQKLQSMPKSTDRADSDMGQNNVGNSTDSLRRRQRPEFPSCQEDSPENDPVLTNNKAYGASTNSSNWASGRTLMDEDDDRDLESAIEALDLESSDDDKTLEEMNKAIDELRVWKEYHEQQTQQALRELHTKQSTTESAGDNNAEVECEDSLKAQLESKWQQQQRDREAQTLELQKEADAFQHECSLYRTTLDESATARMEQALQSDADSADAALSRLRNDLFQLDVKQRQEALLKDLQGAEDALDMNIVDVQAFTGELDAILAQFDEESTNNGDEHLIT